MVPILWEKEPLTRAKVAHASRVYAGWSDQSLFASTENSSKETSEIWVHISERGYVLEEAIRCFLSDEMQIGVQTIACLRDWGKVCQAIFLIEDKNDLSTKLKWWNEIKRINISR